MKHAHITLAAVLAVLAGLVGLAAGTGAASANAAATNTTVTLTIANCEGCVVGNGATGARCSPDGAGGCSKSTSIPASRCRRRASRAWCRPTNDTTMPDAPARAVRPERC